MLFCVLSGKDNMLPSEDEAQRLMKSLQNCKARSFKDNGHTLLLVREISHILSYVVNLLINLLVYSASENKSACISRQVKFKSIFNIR